MILASPRCVLQTCDIFFHLKRPPRILFVQLANRTSIIPEGLFTIEFFLLSPAEPGVVITLFQCRSCIRAVLNFVQHENRFPSLKNCVPSHQRGQQHGDVVNFQRLGKHGTILRIFKEIQIDNVVIVLFGEIQKHDVPRRIVLFCCLCVKKRSQVRIRAARPAAYPFLMGCLMTVFRFSGATFLASDR